MTADETMLRQLNDQYLEAFMKADANWYREHLAEDFVCIESDGSVLVKDEFLVNAAKGPDVSQYSLDEVNVRIYGDVALIQATGLFTRRDGSSGISRYLDIYARQQGSWKAVSAQITHVPQRAAS